MDYFALLCSRKLYISNMPHIHKTIFTCPAVTLLTAGMLCITTSAAQTQTLAPATPQQAYEWQSVPIRGGGFVPGIIMHPTAPGVRYCRTDMGGAYRWDVEKGEWQQLLDWVPLSDANLQGVESIAIDPRDPQHVMLACGTYTGTNASILVSNDGCKTFHRTDVPFGMGGNEDGRGNGERLMIDPARSEVAYFGSRLDGLWRTDDNGQTWKLVSSFPAPNAITVVFAGRDIYVASSVINAPSLYCSHDDGKTWQAVQGQPQRLRPTHMVLSADQKLYLSYADAPGPSQMRDGYVCSYDLKTGAWRDITPFKGVDSEPIGFGYAAIAVDAQNPQHLITSTHSLWGKYGFGDDELFRTTDGGQHWTPIFKHGHEYDCTLAPYTEMAPLHWMFDIEIDPLDSDHAFITTGFGGWETFNLSAASQKNGKVRWSLLSKGIEETVPLELYCPPTGARLLSGIGDYGGFTHDDITQVCDDSNSYPHFANTDGITGAWHNPDIAVRVGEVFHGKPGELPISWSADGGHTWQMCPTVPEERSAHGHIAVSADGASWIWTPNRKPAYRTTDQGQSWQKVQGLPNNIRTIADKENPQRFYAVDIVNRHLFVSEDAGESFRQDSLLLRGERPLWPGQRRMPQARGDNRGGQDRVYATPGHEGDLWIPAYDGLYHLDLKSESATHNSIEPSVKAFSQVRTIYGFGFGKGLTPDYPALYIIGVVNGQYGFFRSDDAAKSWVRINDDDHQYGLVLHIIGDMQEYGRVYVGTHGRGIITGQIKK